VYDRRDMSGTCMGRWAVLLVAALTVASGAAAAVGGSVGAAVAVPPYAVGVRTETFVDSTRPTPANRSYPGSSSRTLPTVIWYPARGVAGAPAHPNAAPASGRFPLVVFAHGDSSSGPDNEPLLSQLAAAGYVVAAPTFPLSSKNAPGGHVITDYVHQPADVSFVLTSTLRLGRTSSPLRGVINPSRVGGIGDSLGATTMLGVAANSCCFDRRIRAAVTIAGIELPFPNGTFFSTPGIPWLIIHGDTDPRVPYTASQKIFADAPSPKFFLTLHGAPHTAFRQSATASQPAPPWEPVIVHTVIDFFDHYLKGQPAALTRLTNDANVSGVASLQQG
jgi:dienelactone hydrolase